MTPAAVTPAGRSKTDRAAATTGRAGAAAAPPANPGHRRKVQRPAASPRPRRVSGPLKGRTAAPAAPATPAPSRPAPPRTRTRPRPEAPPRRRARRRRAAARPAATGSLGARALASVRALPDHPWLDRAVRGRAWIAILGVMLAGIVAMQVEVLKLGASIGRSIQRSTTLQARNEQLRAAVGSLNDDQRIEALAAKRGMVMPSPDSVGFLSANRGKQVARVLGGIRAPDAGSFLALTTDNGAVTTGAGTDPTAPPSTDSTGTGTAAATAVTSTGSTGTATADTSATSTGSTGSTGTGAAADTSSSSTPTDTQTAVAQAAPTSTDSQSTTSPTGG